MAVPAAFAAGRVSWPTWVTAALTALLAAVATVGRKPIEVLGARLAAPVDRLARRSAAKSATLRSAQRVAGARSRVALNVHPAIPLPQDADRDLSSDFPEYVARGIDADLRAWIRARVKSGGLVVLVGDAAAGKTRCLYEALCAEVPDWWMPQLDTGAQINALVHEGVDLSRTVIWLDEFQNFFADEPLTAGSVRQLAAGLLGPVLLAGTIRAQELDGLLAAAQSEGEPETADRHHAREVIRMLARWSAHSGGAQSALRFHLDSSLTPEELARARALAAIDPRLQTALRDAAEGNLTATLAGAPELIDRWTRDTGNPPGQAIITAAVTARRCGHPEPIPLAALEALALSHLRGQARVPAARDWARTAISWAENAVIGEIAALRRAVTTPGVIDGYRVSDILLQHSYHPAERLVQPMLDDDSTWTLLTEHAAPQARADIGLAADAAGKVALARHAWQAASSTGDARAMRMLGWSYANDGEQTEAAGWFRQAFELGDVEAILGLATSLERSGDLAGEERWLRQGARHGDPASIVALGFCLSGEGRLDEAESWYRRAADLGEAVAMANLGYLFKEKRGDLAAAEHWDRKGAALGNTGAMENLAKLLKERRQLDEAVEWYREAAHLAMARISSEPASFPGRGREKLAREGSRTRSWGSLKHWPKRT